ncbi:MAG TPA: 50S ribosomal protein L11 methyltransferase [Gemmatimonadaceae bacterium]|nr:50S ribosomal protein L11 methyltransferase [Gemmatimonadaceae bacterium]
MSVYAVRVRPRHNHDAVVAALFDAGSTGVHEDGDTLVTSFPDDSAIASLRDRVARVDPGAEVEVDVVTPTDFSEWRGTVRAHTVGGITVAPPWVRVDGPGHVLAIEPAMAFGTGEHETTRLCLSLLQHVIKPGDTVADLGSGSAVLAIAAAKLGARSVAAIEIDPDATSNAEENVARNGVAEVVHLFEADATTLLPLIAPVRVVIANILSSVITELLPMIRASLPPGGEAIFSGILVTERDDVLARLREGGWSVAREESEGDWWSAVAVRSPR